MFKCVLPIAFSEQLQYVDMHFLICVANMTNNAELTCDFFLGQRLEILQPKKGYRAGIDALLLGSAAANFDSKNICELGSGVGVAILTCLARRNDADNLPNLATALEIDENAANLLNQNADKNGFAGLLEIANIDGMKPNSPYENKFDLVFSNPPYFDDFSKIRDPHESRHQAYVIGAPLLNWIKAMIRLVKSNGRLLLIHRADRMYDIIDALQNRAGDIRILPIHPKTRENANRVLISAKKSSKAPTQILPPIFLRDSDNDKDYFPIIDEFCKGGQLSELMGLCE